MADITFDCVEWDGAHLPTFYGTVGPRYVHRLAWEEVHGPIPKGMFVLHRCDNPPCFLVDHLFLGTTTDNMRDCKAKGRTARGIGHGRHKLTEEQVWTIRDGLDQGLVQQVIADEIGCSQTLVSQIRLGKIWRYLTERSA